MSNLVALLSPLKMAWRGDGVVSSLVARSCLLKIPREARSLGGRESSVLKGTGVLTSAQSVPWGEVSHVVSSGWRDAMLAKRHRVFTRRRMLSTSRRTDLGQRCRGSVALFGEDDFCGNMVMAVAMASPRIVCKSGAIERIAASASLGFGEA